MNWSCLTVGGFQWKEFKLYRRSGGTLPFHKWALECNERIADPVDKMRWLTHMQTVQAVRVAGCAHYFVDSGVCAFAKNAVKDGADHTRDESFFVDLPIVVHFPATENSSSWFVGPPTQEKYICTVTGNDHTFMFSRTSEGKVHSYDGGNTSDPQSALDEMWRLLNGLSLYIQAFPECVTEMQTEPMPWLQGPRRMIGRHAIIDEEESRSVSPHFRRGHFRVLQHERFYNRGKVVFIKGTFVKGRAYHVEAEDVCAAA